MTEPEHNLDGIDPASIQKKLPRVTVQISGEANDKLTKMARMHPRVGLTVQGEAKRTGLRGVSKAEMVGHCIDWTWEALQEQQGSKGHSPTP